MASSLWRRTSSHRGKRSETCAARCGRPWPDRARRPFSTISSSRAVSAKCRRPRLGKSRASVAPTGEGQEPRRSAREGFRRRGRRLARARRFIEQLRSTPYRARRRRGGACVDVGSCHFFRTVQVVNGIEDKKQRVMLQLARLGTLRPVVQLSEGRNRDADHTKSSRIRWNAFPCPMIRVAAANRCTDWPRSATAVPRAESTIEPRRALCSKSFDTSAERQTHQGRRRVWYPRRDRRWRSSQTKFDPFDDAGGARDRRSSRQEARNSAFACVTTHHLAEATKDST